MRNVLRAEKRRILVFLVVVLVFCFCKLNFFIPEAVNAQILPVVPFVLRAKEHREW